MLGEPARAVNGRSVPASARPPPACNTTPSGRPGSGASPREPGGPWTQPTPSLERCRVLKFGILLLGLWALLNLVPSAWIVFSVLVRGENVPGLTAVLTESQIQALGDEALAAANSIGVYAHGLSAAFCVLFTIALWKGLLRKARWAFWALAGSALVALLGGVGADYVVGVRFPEINLISGLLLATGFACCATEIFKPAAGLRPGPGETVGRRPQPGP